MRLTNRACLSVGWYRNLEKRSLVITFGKPQHPSVILDERSTDGEAQTHACCFRREERVKDAVLILDGYSASRILHGKHDRISGDACRHAQAPRSTRWNHGLDGILDEVQDHLLHLRRIGENRWNPVTKIGFDGDCIGSQVVSQKT